MSTETAILVVGGVLAVGVAGFVYLKSRRTPAAPDKCSALGSIIGDIAGTFAGPADASANASAKAASTLACKGAGAILPQIKAGAKEVARQGGRVVRSPKSAVETLGVVKRWMLGEGCIGRDCCPPGKHSVVDQRGAIPSRDGSYQIYGNEAGTGYAKKANDDSANPDGKTGRVAWKCIADFPDNRPVPPRQGDHPAQVTKITETGARDHRA